MERKRITPEQGRTYKNKGGGEFLCIGGNDGKAVMQNTASGWTFEANGIYQYEDGSIEWDWSAGGHFVDGKMSAIDDGIEKLKLFHEEMERRNEVERQAEKLIAECRFEEARELLSTLDDEKLLNLL